MPNRKKLKLSSVKPTYYEKNKETLQERCSDTDTADTETISSLDMNDFDVEIVDADGVYDNDDTHESQPSLVDVINEWCQSCENGGFLYNLMKAIKLNKLQKGNISFLLFLSICNVKYIISYIFITYNY